jgi:hypothetical protein
MLFLVAIANLFSKKIATIYGLSFTIVLYTLFMISERINTRKKLEHRSDLEKFNLDHQAQVSDATLRARPGCVLVAVRDYHRMWHLERVLEKTNLRRQDIVVMTVRQLSAGDAEYDLRDDQVFAGYEQELFSHVSMAEKRQGRGTAGCPRGGSASTRWCKPPRTCGLRGWYRGIARMSSEELAQQIGLAWERLPPPRHPFSLEVIVPDRPSTYVNLGPHPPRLWPEDVDRLHDLWLRLTAEHDVGSKLHHRDIIGLALQRLDQEFRRTCSERRFWRRWKNWFRSTSGAYSHSHHHNENVSNRAGTMGALPNTSDGFRLRRQAAARRSAGDDLFLRSPHRDLYRGCARLTPVRRGNQSRHGVLRVWRLRCNAAGRSSILSSFLSVAALTFLRPTLYPSGARLRIPAYFAA